MQQDEILANRSLGGSSCTDVGVISEERSGTHNNAWVGTCEYIFNANIGFE